MDQGAPIRHEILGYLMDHPDAQDTLEGIAEWWLLERFVERMIGEVEKAMEELVARRFVIESRGPDARVRYRLNPEMVAEIEALLAGGANEAVAKP